MDRTPIDLVLASESPRRASLLRDLGLAPRTEPPRVPEDAIPGETAESHVSRLAARKARAVAARVAPATVATVVLAADTEVVLGEEVLGKPASPEDAVATLLRLAGREHRVVTGVHLIRPALRDEASAIVSTTVRFAPFGEKEARRYAATGEGDDKAGAYAIQGKGALLVEAIAGSWSNVVGLPLERLPALFREVGWNLWDSVS